MRSTVVALTCLFAVAATVLFLVLGRPSVESGIGLDRPTGVDATSPGHADLIAALNRVSDETRNLRLQMTELSREMRTIAGPAARRAISAEGDAFEDSAGTPRVESPRPSGAALREKVSQPPDPERRKRFDDLAGQSQEQQSNRARSHWFLTYAEVMDRYGAPDWVSQDENGSVSIGYTLRAGTARITFRDGLVVGIQAP